MRSSSSNLYSFSGLGSSSSYKNPVTSSPSTSSYSPYSSSVSSSSSALPPRFSSSSITPGSPSPLVSSSFLLDPPRKLSSIPDYGCAPSASSYESRLSSRRASSSDVRSVVQQQAQARQTRTTETDSLLELYGVRGRGAAPGAEPAKRKSSAILDERKKGGLPTLDEDVVRFRRGSREGIFDLPGGSRGDPRDLLLGGRIASEGSRFGEKMGGGGLIPSASMVGGGPGGLGGELNQIEYTNRLMEAHRKVDDLLRRRGLSAEDERKYLRAWEEIPVVREVRNADRYARQRSNSSDSGLSTDSDETKERPLPEVNIEADEDWEVDEFDEAHADAVLPESPTEHVEWNTRAFGKTKIDGGQVIQKKAQTEIARKIIIQPMRSLQKVSATFAAPPPQKIAVVDVEKSMKKKIHREGVLKSLTIPKRTSTSVALTVAVTSPVVVKKDDKSCTFRAPSRTSSIKDDAPSGSGLLNKVLLRRGRPATTSQAPETAPKAPERPILRKVRTGSLDVPQEPKKPSPPRHLHPLDACKTILASLRPKRDRLSRSSAEISVQHCSFFQTAQTIIAKARLIPEKNVRINLRLTERAPNREKAKIVLACARVAIARLDINLRPTPVRRRTIQLIDPEKKPEKRRIGKLERSMTLEAPLLPRQERPVRPLQIPQPFLEKTQSQEEPETKEDFKAAREKLRKVPFVDCLTGLDLPIYWLDSPNAAIQKTIKRKESEGKRERLLERLIGKKTDASDASEQKLKRQNAFKKKRRGVDLDTVSCSSLGGDHSSSPPLNADRCSGRRATPVDSERRTGQPCSSSSLIAHSTHSSSTPSIPDIICPPEYSATDRALIRSFRASLTIPKPVALRRPVTPLPLTPAAANQAEHRLRDYRSPPPPVTFVQRRTPPRK